MQLKTIIMKKYFIIALTIFINFTSNAILAQTNSTIKTRDTPPDSRTRILGIWYRDEDRTAYWEFKNDDKVYCYLEGVLEAMDTFSISHSCGENSDAKFEFLKLIDADGDEYCSEINGINEDNSGILSLTSMQNFRVALFVNNKNIVLPARGANKH